VLLLVFYYYVFFFFFSSRRRHTRWPRDWSSDVCSSDLVDADRASPGGDLDLVTGGAALDERFLDAREMQLLRIVRREQAAVEQRSEERRVGKECRWGWSAEA